MPTEIDPLIKASAYGDKTVWSYHNSIPVPWIYMKPRDYGSAKIDFSATGVREVGHVPAPGVHPRIFFSPEDVPALRKRLKEDPAAQAAWLNILAWSHALKLDYDEKADYAQPDWAQGGFGVHGRMTDLMRIGGYGAKREDFYTELAQGQTPKYYEKDSPANFFRVGSTEAFRCLIDDDTAGAQKLAAATITAIRLEQARCAREDKPVEAGQPLWVSTPRAAACALGFIYDFIFNYLTPEQKQIIHDELVTTSAWGDNYGTFNNAESSRSNWATFTYWVFDLMAIEGEPGFNDLKFLGLYRGWRNFYNYSFFDSGAAYEGEGKLLFGLDAVVAFDRIGFKYGLQPLSQHPLPRSYYGKFSAYAMLPTRDSWAVFDILGGIDGGFTTPQDLVVAKYLFPQDKTTDFVYRALVGDDYKNLPHAMHFHWLQAITSAVFATAYDPANTPEKLNIPPTFFCGQRALMMTRSSWDKDATFLTMHVRGASGGHPYRDRTGLMLAAKGRPWVTIPNKDIGGWACDTVLIDQADQNASTPGRVVDFVDQPQATFLVGDAKYCWDWNWSSSAKNQQGEVCSLTDATNNNIDTSNGSWQPVEQTFNDFAYTKTSYPGYNRPLKINPSWIAMDGAYEARIRQVNLPILRCFRTSGLVRGPHPYILVVDDVQRNAMPARYDWNLTLMPDVVQVGALPQGTVAGDVLLAGKASLNPDGSLRAGEPALLIRTLNCAGQPEPMELKLRDKENILSLHTTAVAPDFKMLLYAFRQGEPLPVTAWQGSGRVDLTVAFTDQKDEITFTPSVSGKTDLILKRDGQVLAQVNKPVPALNDPDSAKLTDLVKSYGPKVEALRQANFSPTQLPGFVAGYRFDAMQNGAYPPMTGSTEGAPSLPGSETTTVEGGLQGRKAALTSGKGLVASLDLAQQIPGPCTFSLWFKTHPDPTGGNIYDLDGLGSLGMWQDLSHFGEIHLPRFTGGCSMFGSWTQFTVTCDGETYTVYRNGLPLGSAPVGNVRIKLGTHLRLGGDTYGNADCTLQEAYFYNSALSAEDVEKLYLGTAYLPAH